MVVCVSYARASPPRRFPNLKLFRISFIASSSGFGDINRTRQAGLTEILDLRLRLEWNVGQSKAASDCG